jgi:hypothetical protein
VKLAVTSCGWFIGTVHVTAVPLQAPVQPEKVDPVIAAAVRVTLVLCVYASLQSVPHVIPAGADVILPDPEPLIPTFSRWL